MGAPYPISVLRVTLGLSLVAPAECSGLKGGRICRCILIMLYMLGRNLRSLYEHEQELKEIFAHPESCPMLCPYQALCPAAPL